MGQERDVNSTGDDPIYTRAKELWGKFVRGTLTPAEREEFNGGLNQDNKGEIKELFK